LKRTYEDNDALKRYEDEIDEIDEMEQNLIELTEQQNSEATCRCGDVLRGIISPAECPLFRRACSPHRPIGPCMQGGKLQHSISLQKKQPSVGAAALMLSSSPVNFTVNLTLLHDFHI